MKVKALVGFLMKIDPEEEVFIYEEDKSNRWEYEVPITAAFERIVKTSRKNNTIEYDDYGVIIF